MAKLLTETDYLKRLKQFLDENKISYQKQAPSMFMPSGLPDVVGVFSNGKVFRIELKRFNKKSYSATLLQKYQMLQSRKNQELVFYINSEDKFNQFCAFVNQKQYLMAQ